MKKTIRVLCALLCLLLLFPMTAAAADEPEEEPGIPAALFGIWEGDGKSKSGGDAVHLTVRISPDGSGEYGFDMGNYHESYPFTLSLEDSRFLVDTPDEYPGKIEGTWELRDDVLVLDITSTFASGGVSSYLAECTKTKAAMGIDAEYKWLSYTLRVDTVELVPGSEVDRSPMSAIKNKTFAKIRLLAKDGEIATEDISDDENIKLFRMTDTEGEELPLYSVSYWNVGFDMATGTFSTAETQEGFFLYFLAENELGTDDLVLTVGAEE